MSAWVRAVGFIGLVALGPLAGPRPGEAGQPAKVPRVGLLATSPSPRIEAFLDGLRELGYLEGQTVVIERRYADYRLGLLPEMATELARLRVAVIVAPDPPSARAASRATNTIPIVMRTSDDPVLEGFVASIARPRGNVTGVYSMAGELVAKRLELLKEVVPAASRVAVLWNPDWPSNLHEYKEAEGAARALGVQLQSAEARRAGELESAFRAATLANAGALITLRNPLIVSQRTQIVVLAARTKIPAIYDEREFVEAGGLMAYGASLPHLYRRLATYVDKILKGAKPADLPVEQPMRFELTINLKTARALGLPIPQAVLIRADQVFR